MSLEKIITDKQGHNLKINQDGSINVKFEGIDQLDEKVEVLYQRTLNILDYGAIGDGKSHKLSSKFSTLEDANKVYPHAISLDDEIDWCAIQGAVNRAQITGQEVIIPSTSQWYMVNRTIRSPKRITIRGEGNNVTIRPLTSDFDVIHIGDSSITKVVNPMASLENIKIDGFEFNPNTKKRAVLIDGLPMYQIKKVQAYNVSIGFDMIGNCYGAKLDDCQAKWGVNLGINLQGMVNGEFQAGNDIVLNNCWFGGRDGGICVGSNYAGLTVIGGQISGGDVLKETTDVFGAVTLGYDYLDGKSNSGNVGRIVLHGVDLEGFHAMWGIRAYGIHGLELNTVAIIPYDKDGLSALGIYKNDRFGVGHNTLIFQNCHITGTLGGFKEKLISINAISLDSTVFEVGTFINTDILVNGVESKQAIYEQGMLGFSGYWVSHIKPYSIYTDKIRTNESIPKVELCLVYNNENVEIPANRLVCLDGVNGVDPSVVFPKGPNNHKVFGITKQAIPPKTRGYVFRKGVCQLESNKEAGFIHGQFVVPDGTEGIGKGSNTKEENLIYIMYAESNTITGNKPKVVII